MALGMLIARAEGLEGLTITHCSRTVTHLLLGNGKPGSLSPPPLSGKPHKASLLSQISQKKEVVKMSIGKPLLLIINPFIGIWTSLFYTISQLFSWFSMPRKVPVSMCLSEYELQFEFCFYVCTFFLLTK